MYNIYRFVQKSCFVLWTKQTEYTTIFTIKEYLKIRKLIHSKLHFLPIVKHYTLQLFLAKNLSINIDIDFFCSRFDIPGGIWIHLSSPVCLHAYSQIHYSMPFYCACTIPMWTRVPYFNFVNVTLVFRGKSCSETST